MNLNNMQIHTCYEFSKKMEDLRIVLRSKIDRDIYQKIFLPLYRQIYVDLRQRGNSKLKTYEFKYSRITI